LRRQVRPLFEKILGLAELCDEMHWKSIKPAREKYLLYPEVEFIEYDATTHPESEKKPSIEPHGTLSCFRIYTYLLICNI